MSERHTRVGRALGLAELGHAQWFFGNLYEAIVRVPDLLAEHRAPMSPLAPGSPVRYYTTAMPVTFPVVLAAAVASRRDRGSLPWLLTAAAASLAGVGITAYLVRSVNRPLLHDTEGVTPQRRDELLRTWHRLNTVRTATAAAAWLATRTARSRLARHAENPQ